MRIRTAPFADIGIAKIDTHRSLRQGVPEVIFGAAKTEGQIKEICRSMLENRQKQILITRLSPEKAAASLERFTGAHRRFELTDIIDGVEIFHDYGHNPTEMRNALSIARKRCSGRLWAVMQPHTFSRVRALFQDYLCVAAADFTHIYHLSKNKSGNKLKFF